MLLSSDPNLLAAFRRGDPRALETVYRHHLPDVERALARGFPFQAGDASLRFFGYSSSYELCDAVQETFLRAFSAEARAAYDGAFPYRPYLLTLARNLVISRHRHARIAPDRLCTVAGPNGPTNPVETDFACGDARAGAEPILDPETAALCAEARALVADFVAAQSDADRELLRVHFEEERSQEAAALHLGLRRSEVRTRVETVRERLLRFLKTRGFIESVDRGALLRALHRVEG